MIDLIELDQIAKYMAAISGKPLPEVTLSPRLQRCIDWVEQRYGVQVLARPHTFTSGVLGMAIANERAITVYVHPDFPENESIRILAHEAGHEEQRLRRMEFDRTDLDNYIACEESADELGKEIANEWGEGALFDDEYMRQRHELHGQLFEALDGLSFVSGIRNALILRTIANRIIFLSDPLIGANLRTKLGGEDRKFITWKELTELCFSHPEWLVGFDRSALLSNHSLNRGGSTAENRLSIENEEDAAQLLGDLLRYRHEGHRYSKLVESDGRPTHFIVFSGDWTAGGFAQTVQNAMISGIDHHARLSWQYARTQEQAIYACSIVWDENSGMANYRIYWMLDKYHLGQERGRRMDAAVRFFINAFRRSFDILERAPAEIWGEQLYFLLEDRPDVPLIAGAPDSHSRPADRSAKARFLNDMRAVMETARLLDIGSNPSPEALYDPGNNSVQIWCTPEDHPLGWDDVQMTPGAFTKPCALVGGVWWDSKDGVIHLKTDASELQRDGVALSTLYNRPADIHWAIGKILALFERTGIAEPPPIVIAQPSSSETSS